MLNACGATEVNLIGTECPWTTGLHVCEDLIVLEVVDENHRPVPPGVVGRRVLITTLFNRTLPLIRYEFSDLVSLAEGPCPCGRPHLRLASMNGRHEDVLSLPARSGGRIEMHVLHLHALLLCIPEIRQFQVTQEPEGLSIRVALRPTNRAREILQLVRRTVRAELDRVGATVETVSVRAVEEIGRSGNGAKERMLRLCG